MLKSVFRNRGGLASLHNHSKCPAQPNCVNYGRESLWQKISNKFCRVDHRQHRAFSVAKEWLFNFASICNQSVSTATALSSVSNKQLTPIWSLGKTWQTNFFLIVWKHIILNRDLNVFFGQTSFSAVGANIESGSIVRYYDIGKPIL